MLPGLGLALATSLFAAPAGAGTAILAMARTETAGTAAVDAAAADRPWIANHVVVRKAEHKLFLYHDKTLIAEYPVELGLSPSGQKERENDFRTPEGHYMLVRRNPHSDYFLSIEVSYPNKLDEQRARRHHWTPGGEIMIHGDAEFAALSARLLRDDQLDERLHRAVEFQYGRSLDAHRG